YARKLFSDLNQSLMRCVRAQYEMTVQQGGFAAPDTDACAAIVAIPSNEPLRDILYAACANNPLLRFRIYSLKRMFEAADTILATLQAHERRVLWHLRRIYRTRNMIVHAGRTTQFRETLVENVHAYLHQIVNALEDQYSTSPYPSTLDA